jgi:hypothetical protein
VPDSTQAAEAFFVPEGERYVATELTRGPWTPDAQHAGPPAALIGREIERAGADREAQVARITLDILRPVPIAPLQVEARVVRPGRSVELIEASLSDETGELIRARAWRLRTVRLDLPDRLPGDDPPPGPEDVPAKPFFATGAPVGYHTAMEVRFAAGAFMELGPATAWMRMRCPLVAGETPSPLSRVLVAADSGNGVSATLDYDRYTFLNTDLTVSLRRPPAGEWVCLDATTYPEPHGVGLADTTLYDERGWIGRATQTLLVSERAAGG